MTSVMTDKLANYKDKKPAKTKPEPGIFKPPTIELPTRTTRIIGMDQSLAAFGVVQLLIEGGEVTVLRAHKITTDPAHDGHEGSLRRSIEVYEKLSHLFYVQYKPWEQGYSVAHEAPPAHLQFLKRPESTLMSATALRIAMHEMKVPVLPMVNPQAHAKFMTGNARADKVTRRKYMPAMLEQLDVQNREKIKNEAVRDAFSVALYAACRQEE